MKNLTVDRPAYIVNGDMVADINGGNDSNKHGVWIDCANISQLSFEVSWTTTNTPIGVLKVMVSNAKDVPSATAGKQLEVVGHDSPGDGSGSTETTIDIEVSFRWARLFYDRTSGGGSALLQAAVFGKK